jgi:hypothetical protein
MRQIHIDAGCLYSQGTSAAPTQGIGAANARILPSIDAPFFS